MVAKAAKVHHARCGIIASQKQPSSFQRHAATQICSKPRRTKPIHNQFVARVLSSSMGGMYAYVSREYVRVRVMSGKVIYKARTARRPAPIRPGRAVCMAAPAAEVAVTVVSRSWQQDWVGLTYQKMRHHQRTRQRFHQQMWQSQQQSLHRS